MIKKFSKIYKNTLFRLSLLGALLFVLSLMVVAVSVYYVTVIAELNRIDKLVETEHSEIQKIYDESGFQAVELKFDNDINSIQRYKDQFFEYPKIIIFDGNIFFVAENIRKAREIEEVFRAHILIQNNANELNLLNNTELAFLSNWDAEKYRRTL